MRSGFHRLGLQARIAQLQAEFAGNHLDATSGEQRAWELLIEAQTGLAALHGLVDEHEKSGTIRGLRSATTKSLQKALRGYRVAFPDEVTQPGIQRSIDVAATRCAASFSLEVENATEEERAGLRQEIKANILSALMKLSLGG